MASIAAWPSSALQSAASRSPNPSSPLNSLAFGSELANNGLIWLKNLALGTKDLLSGHQPSSRKFDKSRMRLTRPVKLVFAPLPQ